MPGTVHEQRVIRSSINKLRCFCLSTLVSDLEMYRAARDKAETVLGYDYFTERIASVSEEITTVYNRVEAVS